jgi:hypothetical protein
MACLALSLPSTVDLPFSQVVIQMMAIIIHHHRQAVHYLANFKWMVHFSVHMPIPLDSLPVILPF